MNWKLVLPFVALTAIALPTALLLPALAQSNAGDAADAAEQVAARASGAFERIDPDLEIAFDPGIVRAETGAAVDVTDATYAGLPPLTDDAPKAIDVPAGDPAARGPAVRIISREMVQPLPVAAAAPAVTPTPAAIASSDPFVIKSILPVEGTIRYGDWFWDENAAPKAGKLVVTVDLDARVISAFRDGHEIGTAVALLGTQSHPTPTGTFPVLRKSREYFSRKYNNAPMPWSLWITNTGIAIHGSTVLNGYASHGCIGVPDEFAAKLFAASKPGDKVIITRGKMIEVGDKVL